MPGRGELRVVSPDRPPLEVCHHCYRFVRFVQVAGHVQCPNCNNVAETCCEGETLAKSSEVGQQ